MKSPDRLKTLLTALLLLLLAAPAHASTRVEVGVFLVDINYIRSSDETFSVLGVMTATWKDASRAPDWQPQLLYVNAQDLDLQDSSVDVLPDGTHRLQQKFRGVFNTPFNLRRFPFDHAALHIMMLPSLSQSANVDLVASSALTGISETTLFDEEWRIDDFHTTTVPEVHIPGRVAERTVDFELDVRRRPAFYVWTILIPLTVIVVMSWSLFFTMPPNIQVTMGALVGLFVYKLAVASQLPRLAYLSYADAVFLFCLVCIASSHAANTYVTWLTEHGETARRDAFRRRCMRLFPLAYVLGMAAVAAYFFT